MKKLYQTYIKDLKDGLNVIILHFMAFAVLCPSYIYFENHRILFLIFIILVFLSLFLSINFFRNPPRTISYIKNALYAPADGLISSVDIVHENEYLKKRAYRIKIFMNIFNVHRNRAPFSGEVQLVKYKSGKMQAAFKEVEASNEQFIISLKTQYGNILFKQIAGLIARRIICNLKKGDKIKTGDIFGMIKFGSAVIIYLPLTVNINVKQGDKVKAGLNILGYFKK